MNIIVRNFPNMLTCGNLICGCIATGAAFHHNFSTAFLFILIGAMFDFFDGNVQSWKQKGSSVFESKDRGHITKEAYVWYQVDTEYNSYLFIIIECLMDTKNPDNMGLYTLRIIHTQDADTLFTCRHTHVHSHPHGHTLTH